MNEFTYYNKCFALISDALFPVKKSGVCPVCGSSTIRRVVNSLPEGSRPFYTVVNKDCIEDYGIHECNNGHTFEVIPERMHFGEPIGIKIN